MIGQCERLARTLFGPMSGEEDMKENVGRIDQTIRSIIGPTLFLAGYYSLEKKSRQKLPLAVMIGGALIIESAITRTCPLNAIMGIDTRKRK